MLFIITFFLIFGWKVNLVLDISAITALALSIQNIYLHKPCNKLKNNIPVISLTLLVVYSTLIVLFNGITDLTPILRATRALVMLIACFSLYKLYGKHYKNPIKTWLFHIYMCLLIHSIIIVIMYYCAPFRQFIYDLTKAHKIVNLCDTFFKGWKVCGLTYGMSQTSVFQIMGIYLLPILIKSTYKKGSEALLALSFPLILFSSILTGKSGIFLFLLTFPLYFTYSIWFYQLTFKLIIKRVVLLTVFLGYFVLIYYFIYQQSSLVFKSITNYNYKEIISTITFKSIVSQTLKPMYFLPDNVITTIFGKGNYGRTKSFYLPSDVGWIKSLFAIGIIGNVLMLVPFLWCIYISIKERKKFGDLAVATIFIMLLTILLNFKELSLLTRNQWTIQAMLLAILSHKNHLNGTEPQARE